MFVERSSCSQFENHLLTMEMTKGKKILDFVWDKNKNYLHISQTQRNKNSRYDDLTRKDSENSLRCYELKCTYENQVKLKKTHEFIGVKYPCINLALNPDSTILSSLVTDYSLRSWTIHDSKFKDHSDMSSSIFKKDTMYDPMDYYVDDYQDTSKLLSFGKSSYSKTDFEDLQDTSIYNDLYIR